MATIFGTVASTHKKQLTSKAGKPFELLIAKVEQKNGEVVEVNLGFPSKAPKNIHAGNFYEFDTEFKFGEHKYKTHKQSSSDSAPAESAAPSGGASGGPKYYEKNAGFLTKTFPVPMDHPDRSIIRQNAMTHAVNICKEMGVFMTMQQEGGTIEEVMDEVRQYAMQVEDFTTGDFLVVLGTATGTPGRGSALSRSRVA